MKRIIRLTESDLTRIVRRVIMENEQSSDPEVASLEKEIEVADENNPPESLIRKIENFGRKMMRQKRTTKMSGKSLIKLKKMMNKTKRRPGFDLSSVFE